MTCHICKRPGLNVGRGFEGGAHRSQIEQSASRSGEPPPPRGGRGVRHPTGAVQKNLQLNSLARHWARDWRKKSSTIRPRTTLHIRGQFRSRRWSPALAAPLPKAALGIRREETYPWRRWLTTNPKVSAEVRALVQSHQEKLEAVRQSRPPLSISP